MIFDLLNDVILLIHSIVVNLNKNYCVLVKIGTEKYEVRKILITFSKNDTKFSRKHGIFYHIMHTLPAKHTILINT